MIFVFSKDAIINSVIMVNHLTCQQQDKFLSFFKISFRLKIRISRFIVNNHFSVKHNIMTDIFQCFSHSDENSAKGSGEEDAMLKGRSTSKSKKSTFKKSDDQTDNRRS